MVSATSRKNIIAMQPKARPRNPPSSDPSPEQRLQIEKTLAALRVSASARPDLHRERSIGPNDKPLLMRNLVSNLNRSVATSNEQIPVEVMTVVEKLGAAEAYDRHAAESREVLVAKLRKYANWNYLANDGVPAGRVGARSLYGATDRDGGHDVMQGINFGGSGIGGSHGHESPRDLAGAGEPMEGIERNGLERGVRACQAPTMNPLPAPVAPMGMMRGGRYHDPHRRSSGDGGFHAPRRPTLDGDRDAQRRSSGGGFSDPQRRQSVGGHPYPRRMPSGTGQNPGRRSSGGAQIDRYRDPRRRPK